MRLEPTEIARLKPADLALDACGAPSDPDGPYIELYQTYLYSTVIAAGQHLVDEKKFVEPDADFYLDRIFVIDQILFNVPPSQGVYRFQWPNGRYLSQRLQQFVMPVLDPPIRIPAGEWIGIELFNPTATSRPVTITFEGHQRIYLR